MNVAVLGETRDGFIKPMAFGLIKMLQQLGIRATYYEKGLAVLDYSHQTNLKNHVVNGIKKSINCVRPRSYQLQDRVTQTEIKHFYSSLHNYDLLIVVSPVPTAFDRNRLKAIEKIRTKHRFPIVLYQNYYLPTRGEWLEKLRLRGDFTLERYDWYLAATISNKNQINKTLHPVTEIGHHLENQELHHKEKNEYRVLLDYPQTGFDTYRQIQISALKQTNTPFTSLEKHHSISEIRQLYRSHCGLFLSSKESFGLPIVENQLCGNHIFTPHKNWCPGHLLENSSHHKNTNTLGDNFIVYDNCLKKLKSALMAARENYQPNSIVKRFHQQYPKFNGESINELETFFKQIKIQEINGLSHTKHQSID